MAQAAQHLRIGIALPDDVDMAHADIDRLARQHAVCNARAHTNRPGIGRLLQPRGFLQGNHHAGIELLPHPRHGGEHRGRDFAHVFGDGLGVFDEVELGAGVERRLGVGLL